MASTKKKKKKLVIGGPVPRRLSAADRKLLLSIKPSEEALERARNNVVLPIVYL